MKIEMTPALYLLADETLSESHYSQSDRAEYDGHKWAHRLAERLPDELVAQHMPSPSDIREKLAGAICAQAVSASRRRPRLQNTLLADCEMMKDVIPGELVRLPGKRYVERGDLYADEQEFLAASVKSDAEVSADKAQYEGLLAKAFVKWRNQELKKGRPAEHLTQMTCWMECGYVRETVASESGAETRHFDAGG